MPKTVTNKANNGIEISKELLKNFNIETNPIFRSKLVFYTDKDMKPAIMDITSLGIRLKKGRQNLFADLFKTKYGIWVSEWNSTDVQLQKGLITNFYGETPIPNASLNRTTAENFLGFHRVLKTIIDEQSNEFSKIADVYSQDPALKEKGTLEKYLETNLSNTKVTDSDALTIAKQHVNAIIKEINKVTKNDSTASQSYIDFWNSMDQTTRINYLEQLDVISGGGYNVDLVKYLDLIATKDNQQWKIFVVTNAKSQKKSLQIIFE